MFAATPKMDKTAAGTMAIAIWQAEEEVDVEEKRERNEKGGPHLAGS